MVVGLMEQYVADTIQALKMFSSGGGQQQQQQQSSGIMGMAEKFMGGGQQEQPQPSSGGVGGMISSMMGGGSSQKTSTQNTFVGMAMGEASKLYDKQSANGNVEEGTTKQDVVNMAAKQVSSG